MHLISLVLHFTVSLLFFLSSTDALNHCLSRRAIDCSDPTVKSLASSAKAIASAYIDPFCSSYLHYSQPVTTITTTISSTTVVTSTDKKGTTTVTVAATDTGPKGKRQENVLSADSAGKVLGYSANIVSVACSCLVAKPSKTSTITKTSTKLTTSTATVTVQETKTVTVTTKVSQSTRTTSQSQTTTKTSQTTQTVTTKTTQTTKTSSTKTSSTSKTSSKTKTSSTASTSKSSSTSSGSSTKTSSTTAQSSVPGPTFYIQFKDPDPARTDQYNNNYLAQAPDEYRATGQGAVINTTPSLGSATLVTFEPATGYIRTVREGWYANAEYFLALTPVYFDTMEFIMANEWQPLVCTISGSYLSCFVQYPNGRGVMQTCPEYVEYYKTPVALGDKEYRPNPNCFMKNMLIIPA